MASLLDCLKPHAVTGIRKAILSCMKEAPNAGLLYAVFEDDEKCLDRCELIEGVKFAVNIMDVDSRKIEEYKSNGSNHCDHKQQTSYQIQVYGTGCPRDTACLRLSDAVLSILGELQKHICACPCEQMFAQGIEWDGNVRSRDESLSKDFARQTALLTVTHKFSPCNPYQLFTDLEKREQQLETFENNGSGLNQGMKNEPWGNVNGNHKRL